MTIAGTTSNDTLFGTPANDSIAGGGGDDALFGTLYANLIRQRPPL